MPRISRNVLSNKACTALKERIANHRFQPGTRLSVEKMAETLENQEGVIQKGDLLGYSRSDFEFHSLIHKTSRNSVLQEMLESLKTKMQPITMEVKPILPRLYEDHLKILEAIRSKDPEEIERLGGKVKETLKSF